MPPEYATSTLPSSSSVVRSFADLAARSISFDCRPDGGAEVWAPISGNNSEIRCAVRLIPLFGSFEVLRLEDRSQPFILLLPIGFEITEGRCGAGDSASFDPEEFVLTQLDAWRGCAKDAANE